MVDRLKQFFRSHRTVFFIGLIVAMVVVFVPTAVNAFGIGDFFSGIVNGILYVIAWALYLVASLGGKLLLGLTVILVWVASYNGFIREQIVNVGWTIVRDLCNMVFIIALLYMAFNMVFGLKKGGSLLTLVINAGLINFSKVISGFVIDVSQVVMLTFVRGFYKIAGGNILEGLGLTKMFSSVGFGSAVKSNVIPSSGDQATIGLVIITIVIALIMIYISVGIILTFIIVLVGRIFKLWSLLIMSPVPFVKKILPGLPEIGGGGGDYWSELSKTAASGPILAFWLWLVFTAVSLYQGQFANKIFGESPAGGKTSVVDGGTLTGQVAGFSQAGSISNILGFIVFIGMLLMALQQAQNQANAMGGLAGKIASKTRGWLHKNSAVKAYNRFIKEPIESKQRLWAQGGGIMKYGNKLLGRLPGPLKTSWAALTTKEGAARAKEMRHAKRMAKGWERTVTGIRLPGLYKNESGKRRLGLRGWKVSKAVLMKRGKKGAKEGQKLLEQAATAKNLVLFKKFAGQGDSWEKIYEEDFGFQNVTKDTIMRELRNLANGPKTDEARARFIAVSNIASKKGFWNGLDKNVLELGGKMFGGEGSYMHRLFAAKVEKDSVNAMGSKAGIISPIRVDPVTKEPVNLMPKRYEQYEEVMEDGGTRVIEGVQFGDEIIPAGGLRQFMGEKLRKDIAAQGPTQAIREFGRGKERSPLRVQSLDKEYDSDTGDYIPMKKEGREALLQDLGLEIEGNIGGLMKALGVMFGKSKASMAHNHHLRHLQSELGGLAGEYLTNMEGYKEEMRTRVLADERFTATLEGKSEEERNKAIEEQISKQFSKELDLSLDGKLLFNEFYRALSLDSGATLLVITREELEEYKRELRQRLFRSGQFDDIIADSSLSDEEKEAAKRRKVDNEVRRRLGFTEDEIEEQNETAHVRKARRIGWSDLLEEVDSEEARQYRQQAQQKDNDIHRAEEALHKGRYQIESADTERGLADVLSNAMAAIDRLRRSMERVFPDLGGKLEKFVDNAREEYEKGLVHIRNKELAFEERRRNARASLEALNGILNTLKEMDAQQQIAEKAADGRGGFGSLRRHFDLDNDEDDD